MMRSLWAGVTGLQAHQIAMDVEGNNIANVNTTGFKYSRANFSDLLNQTAKIATAPQGELGGKNSMQIGLGTQVSSVTKIFKQGSIETTDKNTDLAISGDGFFVISPDGGNTYKYSRNGDFSFDANGNFVDANGYIAQGWVRDDTTGEIDATAPIRNITIPPGLTTPANDTGYITLKANLNSGDSTKNKSAIYALDQYKGWYDKDNNNTKSTTEKHDENDASLNSFNTDNELVERGVDMGVLFNATGEAFNLREGQGIWMSYADAVAKPQSITASNSTSSLKITVNGVSISGELTKAAKATPTSEENILVANEIANLINQKTSETGVVATVENGNHLVLKNTNKIGTDEQHKNINLDVTSPTTIGLTSTQVITAYQYAYSTSSVSASHDYDASVVRKFHTTEDLRNAMQVDARLWTNYLGSVVDPNGADNKANTTNDNIPWSTVSSLNKNDGVQVLVNDEGKFVLKNPTGDAPDVYTGAMSGFTINSVLSSQDVTFPAGTTFENAITLPTGTTVTLSGKIPGDATYGTEGDYTFIGTIPAGFVLSADATLPQGTTFPQFSATINDPLDVTADDRTIDIALTTAAVAGQTYSITIGGTTYTTAAAAGGETAATVAGALYTLIKADYADATLDGTTITLPTNAGTTTINPPTSSVVGTISATISAALAAADDDRTINLAGTSNSIAGQTYSITIGGTTYTYTPAAAGENAATIASGLRALIEADAAYTGHTSVVGSVITINQGAGTENIVASTNIDAVDVTDVGITDKDGDGKKDDQAIYVSITGLTNASNNVSENTKFTTSFSALQGSLPSGTSERSTQNIYMASHASSIDVYDSLGSKHTVRFEFRKIGQTDNGGTEWSMLITVPEPGQINYAAGNLPENIITGSIAFNSDGSLATFTPTNLTYTANNGSSPNQNIELHFGTLGQFDGMTSFNKESNTSGISQDGYPGGDLSGIRVDETGTLIGSFTNGRSFGLAQVAMAKFTNNEGLESDGGNTFIQTSNSGDPVIGQASVGGRGAIQASSLEMSNVDLSRSLTQLIVIQRGYQANSKTITTSDEMLNTLLQLK